MIQQNERGKPFEGKSGFAVALDGTAGKAPRFTLLAAAADSLEADESLEASAETNAKIKALAMFATGTHAAFSWPIKTLAASL